MRFRVSSLLSFFIFVLLVNCSHAQYFKEFNELYKKINSKVMVFKKESEKDSMNIKEFKRDSTAAAEILDFMSVLKKFLDEEHKLNGKGILEFSGHESSSNNLFKFGAGASIDHGIYPYELDFSTEISAVLKDGEFQENISDIDISFDFHPIGLPDFPDTSLIPLGRDQQKRSDHLWLENFLFLKRFNDDFLGIDQRYEMGMGVIFNLLTCGLTPKGEENRKELNKTSDIKLTRDDLKKSLDLSDDEIETLQKTREAVKRANRKQYSKLRLGLLAGLYYEIEDAKAFNTIPFNNVDTLITESFDISNKLRWEIRPTFVWQPNDKYKLQIRPYIKLPFKYKDTISFGAGANKKTDVRKDLFFDVQSSFKIEVEEDFTIGLEYRLLYDCAPRRKYLIDMNGMPVLLIGQRRHSNFGLSFEYNF